MCLSVGVEVETSTESMIFEIVMQDVIANVPQNFN